MEGPSGGEQKPATAARIYDYLLGGAHNFPADREAAEALTSVFPEAAQVAKLNRAFLRRAIRYLSQAGIRQFLDVGSGIPTEGNVHEIAQEVAPDARVVYVDIDPVAVMESMELLAGNEHAFAIRADARDPQAILQHPRVQEFFDFEQPVGLLMVALLQFMADDVAYDTVSQLQAALPAGSHMVASHVVNREERREVSEADSERVNLVYQQMTTSPLRLRNRAEIVRFFDGLELVDPGVVWVGEWRPDPQDPVLPEGDPARHVALGGVGRVR